MKLFWILGAPAVAVGGFMLYQQFSGTSSQQKVDAQNQCQAALDAPENKGQSNQNKTQTLVVSIGSHNYLCSRQTNGLATAERQTK